MDNLPSLNAPFRIKRASFASMRPFSTGVTANAVPVWVAIGGGATQPSVTSTVK